MGAARGHAAGVRAIGPIGILAVAAEDGEMPIVLGRNSGNLAILRGNLGKLGKGNRTTRPPPAPEANSGASGGEELDGVTLTRIPVFDFRFGVRVEDAASDRYAIRTRSSVRCAARFTGGARDALKAATGRAADPRTDALGRPRRAADDATLNVGVKVERPVAGDHQPQADMQSSGSGSSAGAPARFTAKVQEPGDLIRGLENTTEG